MVHIPRGCQKAATNSTSLAGRWGCAGQLQAFGEYHRRLAFRPVSFIALEHEFKAKQKNAKQCNARNHNHADH
jgi:hypothetical protein